MHSLEHPHSERAFHAWQQKVILSHKTNVSGFQQFLYSVAFVTQLAIMVNVVKIYREIQEYHIFENYTQNLQGNSRISHIIKQHTKLTRKLKNVLCWKTPDKQYLHVVSVPKTAAISVPPGEHVPFRGECHVVLTVRVSRNLHHLLLPKPIHQLGTLEHKICR